MPRVIFAATFGALLAAAGQCLAASPPTAATFDPSFLDELANERNAARGPQQPIALPPAPYQRLRQPRHLTVCMSVQPWSPIYAKPDVLSPVIGRTTNSLAALADTEESFVRIERYDGKGVGYVLKPLVKPYHSDIRPNGTCTVAIAADGSVLFHIN